MTQARRWFEVARRNAATTETLSDREILDNPYRIAESDLGTLEEPAVSVGMVDVYVWLVSSGRLTDLQIL